MNNKLANMLLVLRITVAIVFIMWAGNKFINPVHAQNVYSGFFFMPELGMAIFLGIGLAEAILIALFITGTLKSFSYLLVLVLHTVSTIAPYNIYLNAYSSDSNLLFFTAFPMWGACFVLYMMREYDTKMTLPTLLGKA